MRHSPKCFIYSHVLVRIRCQVSPDKIGYGCYGRITPFPMIYEKVTSTPKVPPSDSLFAKEVGGGTSGVLVTFSYIIVELLLGTQNDNPG